MENHERDAIFVAQEKTILKAAKYIKNRYPSLYQTLPDALSDAQLAALLGIPECPEGADLEKFISRRIQNFAREEFRKKQRRAHVWNQWPKGCDPWKESNLSVDLESLDERERDMICLRYGIDCDEESVDVIAELYSLNRATVYRIVDKAIEKLRDHEI